MKLIFPVHQYLVAGDTCQTGELFWGEQIGLQSAAHVERPAKRSSPDQLWICNHLKLDPSDQSEEETIMSLKLDPSIFHRHQHIAQVDNDLLWSQLFQSERVLKNGKAARVGPCGIIWIFSGVLSFARSSIGGKLKQSFRKLWKLWKLWGGVLSGVSETPWCETCERKKTVCCRGETCLSFQG